MSLNIEELATELLSFTQSVSLYIADNYIFTLTGAFIFFTIYTAFALPAAFLVTILIGALFGFIPTVFISCIGGTLGSLAVFLLTKYLLKDFAAKISQKWLRSAAQDLRKKPISLMISMRLNPALPFLVQNILPAAIRVDNLSFVIASLIGLIPPSIALALVGTSISSLSELDADELVSHGLSGPIVWLFVGLSLLLLLPIAFKFLQRIKKKNN